MVTTRSRARSSQGAATRSSGRHDSEPPSPPSPPPVSTGDSIDNDKHGRLRRDRGSGSDLETTIPAVKPRLRGAEGFGEEEEEAAACSPLLRGAEQQQREQKGGPRTRRLEELPDGWTPQPGVLTGYRVDYTLGEATRSVFQGGHNEVWNIWTDLAPGALFAALFAAYLTSAACASRTPFERWLASGVFVACMCCRAGSTLTHVYNCVSLRMSQTLVYVDLMGISCMAFGSPWIYYVANRLDASAEPEQGMRGYVLLLGSIMAVCLVLFGALFATGRRPPKFWLPLLVMHAAVGNAPGLQMALDPGFPAVWRAFALMGVLGFVVGYVVFYTLRVPERWMEPGAADGKWWNSHVIWHVCGDVSQLFYCLSTFLPMPREF